MTNAGYMRSPGRGDSGKKRAVKELEDIISSNKEEKIANFYTLLKKSGKKDVKKESIENWEKLINLPALIDEDLTTVKIFRLREKIKDPKKFFKNRKNQVEWDLFRMYRVRNAIVHEGDPYSLTIPLDLEVSMLESYYIELFEIIIDTISLQERFKNIEQLFLSYEKTFEYLISSAVSLSKIENPAHIKSKITEPKLIF